MPTHTLRSLHFPAILSRLPSAIPIPSPVLASSRLRSISSLPTRTPSLPLPSSRPRFPSLSTPTALLFRRHIYFGGLAAKRKAAEKRNARLGIKEGISKRRRLPGKAGIKEKVVRFAEGKVPGLEEVEGKFVTFQKTYLHLSPKRFVGFRKRLVGLTLDQAVLQARWNQRRTGKMVEKFLWSAAQKAGNEGLDVKKLVVARTGLIVPAPLPKNYPIFGRGTYGAIPHAKTCLFQIVLAERDAVAVSPRLPPRAKNDEQARKMLKMKERLRGWMAPKLKPVVRKWTKAVYM
ncbi:hypothetical protein M427DRAFT_50397 [Gonapodya prolifera JEL478]|uniref:Ribosomal protein L22 n=1 Tax=Gonapodya prolifera (strain JEL478) TaxID=1344416 RepID=A0A139AZP5_GONPJ|nr:hypothetical protein M427DRAFT_50397 [Gonapodya prolifera JEL478]|eukprot:KXS22033.1 hypothetical protein M427DRAFT_50397 [Gonapodya prolifera JEL478]